MLVNEIFASIEGEGIRTGFPTTFIRLYGCNLKCSYCDTTYSCVGGNYTKMTAQEVVAKVKDYGFHRVTITGGEPMIHTGVYELIEQLLLNGMEVNIETNGSVSIKELVNHPRLFVTLDYKSISSKMNSHMDVTNFPLLREIDVLKFVVGSLEDLWDMKAILEQHPIKAQIFVSPVFGQIEPVTIVDFIKYHRLEQVRVQIQLHKVIWEPTARGV